TSTGTVTDANGHYSLSVSSGQDTLRFSYIGYQPQTVPIEGRTTINVSLKTTVLSGQQLVVVGYGKKKKINLTGSVETVNFSKTIKNRPILNTSQALEGKLSGVWISQTSGQPGVGGSVIRIRGWGTLNNANPMVLIDG